MQTIAARLIHIVNLLKHAIGVHLDRQARLRPYVPIGLRNIPEVVRPKPPAPPPLPQAAYELLWHRIHRIGQRFLALFARWENGTLPMPRVRPARTRPARDPAAPNPLRLPRAFGWANKRLAECGAPPAAGTLEDLVLNRAAELRPFLQAAPQAGRLLRPLCQALGVRQPEYLALPQRPRAPRKPRPPRPRPLPLAHPDLGLRPWVVAWVRASHRKYGRD